MKRKMDINEARLICEQLPQLKAEISNVHHIIAKSMTKRDSNLLFSAFQKLQQFQLAFENFNFKEFGQVIGQEHMKIIWGNSNIKE